MKDAESLMTEKPQCERVGFKRGQESVVWPQGRKDTRWEVTSETDLKDQAGGDGNKLCPMLEEQHRPEHTRSPGSETRANSLA